MREYGIPIDNGSILNANGDYDLWWIAPAANKPCKILALYLDILTELGEAQEEHFRFVIIRGHATVGSGGSAATPTLISPGDPAASFTARTLDTAIASAGTPVNCHAGGPNVRSGESVVLIPEIRWEVTQAQTSIVVRLMAAVADDLSISGTLYVGEEG